MENTKSYIKYSQDDINEKELVIDMLFVAHKDRGQKKGYELLQEAMDYAWDNGYKNVSLFVEPQENGITEDALVEYYRNFGFESDGDCDQLMNKRV